MRQSQLLLRKYTIISWRINILFTFLQTCNLPSFTLLLCCRQNLLPPSMLIHVVRSSSRLFSASSFLFSKNLTWFWYLECTNISSTLCWLSYSSHRVCARTFWLNLFSSDKGCLCILRMASNGSLNWNISVASVSVFLASDVILNSNFFLWLTYAASFISCSTLITRICPAFSCNSFFPLFSLLFALFCQILIRLYLYLK
jgi:hypothetical protein